MCGERLVHPLARQLRRRVADSTGERIVKRLASYDKLRFPSLRAFLIRRDEAYEGVMPRVSHEELDAPGGGLSTRGLRHSFARTMRPWWTLLARAHVPPNAVTSLSMAVAAGASIAIAAGRFALGGWLFVTAGALDFLDGRVTRASGQVTPSGVALRSILDRYVESAFIVGLAWYYRQSWVLVVCLLAITGSLLVPYVRARGESLGCR